MEQNNRGIQKDELRMRFTAWISLVMYHARVDSLKRKHKYPKTLDIDRVPEHNLVVEDIYDLWGDEPRDFYFDDKRIDDEIQQLPREQHQILIMLYFGQMTPREISLTLGCTVQNIYNQKSLALQSLRYKLQEKSKDEQSNEQGGVSSTPGKGNRR